MVCQPTNKDGFSHQAFCAEKKIPAHRAAVVLPPELAFQRLLDLPAHLTTDEAREYVLNPTNGLNSIPLTQTDFDLFPVHGLRRNHQLVTVICICSQPYQGTC